MTFFLRIPDPTLLRKDILKSAKDVILLQYKSKTLKRLRQQRKRHKEDIKELIPSLEKRVGSLVEKLNEKGLDVEADITKVAFDDGNEEEQKKSVSPEDLDETDRLEYTLKRIEKTLSNLD